MTKETFIKQYCKNSQISKEEFEHYFIALPCNCGEKECNGWAAVQNTNFAIKKHNKLYNKI